MTHHKQHHLVCGLLALSAVLGGLSTSANAATIYVKANGGSNSYLLSETKNNVNKPYQTIKKALEVALTTENLTPTQSNPDPVVNVVVVEPGNYLEKVAIRQSGLTLKARNDATTSSSRSVLKPVGPDLWNIVSVEASDVTVRGFEVDGTGAYVDGLEEAGNEGQATNGITVFGDHYNWNGTVFIPAARRAMVIANIVHDCGGCGISADGEGGPKTDGLNEAVLGGPDYVTIEGNVVYNNSFWSRYATSGISFRNMTNSSGDTNPHNKILRNRIYGNTAKYTKVDKTGGATHSDGNGIIIDYNGNQNPPTLIENNLIYLNGGRAIHVYKSSNVTVRNNSTYKNCIDPQISSRVTAGEIVLVNGKNVKITNNVSVGRNQVPNFTVRSLDGYAAAGGTLSNIVIRACTYLGNDGSVNIPGGIIDWSTTFYGNPYFVAPDSGNFTTKLAPIQGGKTLAQSQTVIDRGSLTTGDFAPTDYYNTPRPATGKDRGAYEFSLTTAPTSGGAA